MISRNHNNQKNDPVRVIVVPALSVILLLALTWFAASTGWGSLMTTYAARTNQLAAADLAVTRSPRSAEAHYARATILEASNPRQAVAEHREAIKDRPQDHALWLSLARAAELNGDTAQAIAAAQQARLLAPFYSQPHYQLGNLLLRSGRTTQGFEELRAAAESDPMLLPGIIDLAWRLSKGDAQFVERALAPTSSEGRWTLAQYLRNRQQHDAAVRLYAASGAAAAQDRESYVAELIHNGHFRQAATLWGVDHSGRLVPGRIEQPGFETEMDLGQKGFGWQAAEKSEGLRFTLDSQSPAEGKSSLKIEFNGAASVIAPFVSQFVLVEPNSRYRLTFSERSEGIVSAGLPFLTVLDGKTKSELGSSAPFARATEGWREYTVEFTTPEQGEAIQIALAREPCETSPCPIFGRLWLDNFSLQKL